MLTMCVGLFAMLTADESIRVQGEGPFVEETNAGNMSGR